jgi:hypothetical protein
MVGIIIHKKNTKLSKYGGILKYHGIMISDETSKTMHHVISLKYMLYFGSMVFVVPIVIGMLIQI